LEKVNKQAIKDLQAQEFTTKRSISPELEEILYEPFNVLDHGFLRVVDYMGNDGAVVQAARVSYGSGTKKVSEDQGLINYLMRHRHSTPFEMCEIKLHVKLPIFVARQWIRHRTANVNEYSARYSILDNEFYIPAKDQLSEQSTNNKQGRGNLIPNDQAKEVMDLLRNDAERSYSHYQAMLNTKEDGTIIDEGKKCVARELARMNLTLNYYTQWYWKIDLHNFMNFLSLRGDSHAQYEIRVYAEIMLNFLKRWCPAVYEAFLKYRMNGTFLSQSGKDIIKAIINGEKDINPKEFGMSQREWRELREQFSL